MSEVYSLISKSDLISQQGVTLFAAIIVYYWSYLKLSLNFCYIEFTIKRERKFQSNLLKHPSLQNLNNSVCCSLKQIY